MNRSRNPNCHEGPRASKGTNAAGWKAAGSCTDLRGATAFGYDEFARRVAEAQAQNARRSGLFVPA